MIDHPFTAADLMTKLRKALSPNASDAGASGAAERPKRRVSYSSKRSTHAVGGGGEPAGFAYIKGEAGFKRVVPMQRILLVLGYFIQSTVQASANIPSDARDLMLIAKTLADSGRLDDSTYVAQVLHTTFTAYVLPQIGKSCGKAPVSSDEQVGPYYNITKYKTPRDFWFRRSPHGVTLHYRPPGIFVYDAKAPIVMMADPSFLYIVNKIVSCQPSGEQRHSTEAEIDFSLIPGFSCATESQLRAVFPNLIEPRMIMHGYTSLEYVANKAVVEFDPLLMKDGSDQPRCEIGIRIRAAYPDR